MAQHGQLGGLEALVAAARLPFAGSGPPGNAVDHGFLHTSNGSQNGSSSSQLSIDPSLRSLSEAYKGLETSQLLNVLLGQTLPQSTYTAANTASGSSVNQSQAVPNGYEQQISGTDHQATPFQQTRSGRISRPPVQDILQALLAAAATTGRQSHSAPPDPLPASTGPDLPALFQAFAALQQAQSNTSRPPLAEVGTSQGNGITNGAVLNGMQTGEADPDHAGEPVKRKRGRRPLSEEDKLARRRARNKVSALESRQRKKEHMDEMEDQLNAKEDECTALSERVRQLEQEVQMLRGVILGANLVLPGPGTPLAMPTPRQTQSAIQPQAATPQLDAAIANTAQSSTKSNDIPPSNGTASTLAPRFPIPALPSHLSPMVSTTPASMADTPVSVATVAGTEGAFDPTDPAYNTVFDAVPIPSFDMFFNLDPSDMDGEEDGDFLPESSPKLSESEDSGDDGEPETTPRAATDGIAAKSPRSASGKKRRKHKHKAKGKAKNQEDDDDWVDPDQEDEDLFLPIEDVPVPPLPELEDANGLMKEMGIQSQDQLGNVVRRIIEAAGEKEMNPDILGKLKAVLAWTQRDAA